VDQCIFLDQLYLFYLYLFYLYHLFYLRYIHRDSLYYNPTQICLHAMLVVYVGTSCKHVYVLDLVYLIELGNLLVILVMRQVHV